MEVVTRVAVDPLTGRAPLVMNVDAAKAAVSTALAGLLNLPPPPPPSSTRAWSAPSHSGGGAECHVVQGSALSETSAVPLPGGWCSGTPSELSLQHEAARRGSSGRKLVGHKSLGCLPDPDDDDDDEALATPPLTQRSRGSRLPGSGQLSQQPDPPPPRTATSKQQAAAAGASSPTSPGTSLALRLRKLLGQGSLKAPPPPPPPPPPPMTSANGVPRLPLAPYPTAKPSPPVELSPRQRLAQAAVPPPPPPRAVDISPRNRPVSGRPPLPPPGGAPPPPPARKNSSNCNMDSAAAGSGTPVVPFFDADEVQAFRRIDSLERQPSIGAGDGYGSSNGRGGSGGAGGPPRNPPPLVPTLSNSFNFRGRDFEVAPSGPSGRGHSCAPLLPPPPPPPRVRRSISTLCPDNAPPTAPSSCWGGAQDLGLVPPPPPPPPGAPPPPAPLLPLDSNTLAALSGLPPAHLRLAPSSSSGHRHPANSNSVSPWPIPAGHPSLSAATAAAALEHGGAAGMAAALLQQQMVLQQQQEQLEATQRLLNSMEPGSGAPVSSTLPPDVANLLTLHEDLASASILQSMQGDQEMRCLLKVETEVLLLLVNVWLDLAGGVCSEAAAVAELGLVAASAQQQLMDQPLRTRALLVALQPVAHVVCLLCPAGQRSELHLAAFRLLASLAAGDAQLCNLMLSLSQQHLAAGPPAGMPTLAARQLALEIVQSLVAAGGRTLALLEAAATAALFSVMADPSDMGYGGSLGASDPNPAAAYGPGSLGSLQQHLLFRSDSAPNNRSPLVPLPWRSCISSLSTWSALPEDEELSMLHDQLCSFSSQLSGTSASSAPFGRCSTQSSIVGPPSFTTSSTTSSAPVTPMPPIPARAPLLSPPPPVQHEALRGLFDLCAPAPVLSLGPLFNYSLQT